MGLRETRLLRRMLSYARRPKPGGANNKKHAVPAPLFVVYRNVSVSIPTFAKEAVFDSSVVCLLPWLHLITVLPTFFVNCKLLK